MLMKTYKNEVKSYKNINKFISAQKHHQTTIVASFISSVIQFDKFFHPVVLCENYLICIFMNINENFSNERKILEKLRDVLKMTNVSPNMCSSSIKPSANSMLRHCTFTIRYDMKNMYHEYS